MPGMLVALPPARLGRLSSKAVTDGGYAMKGISRTRRVTAVSVVFVVLAALAWPAAASNPVYTESFDPLNAWSGLANGDVIGLSIKLPAVVESALETLNLQGTIPGTISDTIVTSRADAQWNFLKPRAAGRGVAELLDTRNGTIGKALKDLLVIPRADVKVGEEAVERAIAKIDAIPGVELGAGEVAASARNSAVKVVDSSGDSSILNLKVTLGEILSVLPQGVQDQINAAIDSLLALLYGSDTNPEPIRDGVVGALQTQLDAAKEALKSSGVDVEGATGLDLTIPEITRADLLEKPLISIGLIQSTSKVYDGTGSLAGYKVAKARSLVKDISILGGLVHIEALIAEAGVATNGNAGEAKLFPPVQKVIGIRVGTNNITTDDPTRLENIKINGQSIDLTKLGVPADVADAISGLYETLLRDVVGLQFTTPAVTQGIEEHPLRAQGVRQRAFQNVTALNLRVAPLSEPVLGQDLSQLAALLPTLNVKFSTANAAMSNVPLGDRRCISDCNPDTGVPTNLYVVFGPMLLGAAIVVKRFVLSK